MEDNSLKSEFLAEVDEYCEQVSNGIELIRSNQIVSGIDEILRPLHTIKGTSGFIDGLGQISKYTHKVEDYLKGIQSGKIPSTPQIINLIVRAVDTVFCLLDQARNGGIIDDSEGQNILEKIEKTFHPVNSKESGKIIVENKNNIYFIRISMARIHLPGQYQLLIDAFKTLELNKEVVLDLSGVRSIGSTAWGAMWESSRKLKISIIGMNKTCKIIFFAWGFDQFINVFLSEEEFLEKIKINE